MSSAMIFSAIRTCYTLSHSTCEVYTLACLVIITFSWHYICLNYYLFQRWTLTGERRWIHKEHSRAAVFGCSCSCGALQYGRESQDHPWEETLSIDVVYLTDGKHNGPCSSNLKIKVKCFHSRPNINTYCDWESSPWKCSGLGKNTEH